MRDLVARPKAVDLEAEPPPVVTDNVDEVGVGVPLEGGFSLSALLIVQLQVMEGWLL